jgi:hypothetical protein
MSTAPTDADDVPPGDDVDATQGDDPSIADDDEVWRRIPPGYFKPKTDGGPPDFESYAFSDSSNPPSPMSVDLASIAGDPEATRRGFPDHGVVRMKVGALRNAGFGVRRAPLDGNPAHTYVTGPKKQQKHRRRIKKCAEWVLLPPEKKE